MVKKALAISIIILLILLLLASIHNNMFVNGNFGQNMAIKVATEAAIEKYPDFDYENAIVNAGHSIRSQRVASWIPVYVEYRLDYDVFFMSSDSTEYVRVTVHPYLTFIVLDVQHENVPT